MWGRTPDAPVVTRPPPHLSLRAERGNLAVLGQTKLLRGKRKLKAVPCSNRRHYVAVFSIILVVSALLTAGMNCEDGYQLTISSTEGGSVTVPGEGTRSYDAGTVVELVATPDEGYRFSGWTGDTGQITSPSSASTTITMNGSYSVTATFGSQGSGPGPIEPIPPPLPPTP